MTRVYEVCGDVNSYEALELDLPDKELTDYWFFHGDPRADAWKPPPVYSPSPTLKTPDIWTFRFALVFPPEVADKLGYVLAGAGELLPLPYRGETFQVLNITPPVDCLDEERSVWLMNEGRRVVLKELAFHEHRLPDKLFKHRRGPRNFCVEGLAGRDLEFKSTVEDLGLTGLEFRLRWDSEGPTWTGVVAHLLQQRCRC